MQAHVLEGGMRWRLRKVRIKRQKHEKSKKNNNQKPSS
jgi:hypothetical protein